MSPACIFWAIACAVDSVGPPAGTISHTIRYDCLVPEADIVGTPGSLLSIDLSGFALGYAAVYLGIGEAAFDYMLEYAKTKTLKPSTEPMRSAMASSSVD